MKREVKTKTILASIVLFLSPLVYAVARIGSIAAGNSQIELDFRKAWHPIATKVLNGTPLYLAGTGDNKPPLFQFVNILTGFFDHHGYAFLLIIGVFNGITALLIWRLLTQYEKPKVGFLAAFIFVLTLPMMKGHWITQVPLALPFLTIAITTDRSYVSGIAVAVAGLFAQYAVLAVPAVLIVQFLRRKANFGRWAFVYLISGLATLVLTLGLISIIWVPESALAGFNWSYGINLGVTSPPVNSGIERPDSYVAASWLLTRPLYWAGVWFYTFQVWFPLSIPVGLGLWHGLTKKPRDPAVTHFTVMVPFLLLPLMIRSWRDYSLMAHLFVCALAGIGIQYWLGEVEMEEREDILLLKKLSRYLS